MSIKKAALQIVIILALAVTAATSQTNLVAGVKIGALTWTQQNVSIETPDSWCYDDDPSNCAKYGRLYTWEAAKKACAGMGGRWRLPTNKDWGYLVKYAGGPTSGAGKKLKAKSGWNDSNGNGTDDYDFSALGGGYRRFTGSFAEIDDYGSWWSATDGENGNAYYRDMSCRHSNASEHADGYKKDGYSVRCVSQ